MQPLAEEPSEGTITIPTETGSLARLYEPVKKVGYGEDEIELRRLTPEEKARRRLVKNIIMAACGVIFLVVVAWIMLTFF